ncbi:MAG: hypothetical protein J3K34DRAFT_403701 [Monoraphidium minutum]|nr:MAG: hypothetical protein J3K34DRAFT_403701 [Monoraphidium minutum]
MPVGGKAYHTWQTALEVPWVTSSWSVKRVVECDAPLFWLKFTAERAGQDVHLTGGAPAAPGLAAARVGMALFGPGLPPYNASQLGFPAPPAKQGYGMLRVSSPADQSNCDFLVNAVSQKHYKPAQFAGVGRRCAYYEPFSKSNLWITADANVTLPGPKGGVYHLASFLDGRKASGRFTVAVANWAEDEDFVRPHVTAKGNRNVSWSDGAAVSTCCGARAARAGAAAPKAGDVSGCPAFSAFGCDAPPKERASAPRKAIASVAPAAAAALLQQGWRFLEVRAQEEVVAGGRVAGSANVPLLTLGATGQREENPGFVDQVKALFPPCARIVVGCQTGRRSLAAAALLAGAFAELVSMDGGILEWKAAGLPVEP